MQPWLILAVNRKTAAITVVPSLDYAEAQEHVRDFDKAKYQVIVIQLAASFLFDDDKPESYQKAVDFFNMANELADVRTKYESKWENDDEVS